MKLSELQYIITDFLRKNPYYSDREVIVSDAEFKPIGLVDNIIGDGSDFVEVDNGNELNLNKTVAILTLKTDGIRQNVKTSPYKTVEYGGKRYYQDDIECPVI